MIKTHDILSFNKFLTKSALSKGPPQLVSYRCSSLLSNTGPTGERHPFNKYCTSLTSGQADALMFQPSSLLFMIHHRKKPSGQQCYISFQTKTANPLSDVTRHPTLSC